MHNESSGTVYGPSVQAGLIGAVHFHASVAGPAQTPHQLPAPVRHFTGRLSELAQLDRLLDEDRAGLIVLSGPGGVGKTTLAVHWAHLVRERFPGGQLYAELDAFGAEPADPGVILGAFLRALGIPPPEVPVRLAEQVALYRSTTAERALFILVDNAFSVAQTRVLIPASPGSLVLVTSRSRLAGLVPDGARLVPVTPLPRSDSIALLTRIIGADRVRKEPDPAARLAADCGDLPIALCVAGGRLAARPQLSVARAAQDLADEAGRLAQLSTVDGPAAGRAFDLSYRVLPPPSAALYRRLALHPGAEFGTGPVAAVATTVSDSGTDRGRAAFDVLLEASLVQEVAEERFRYHDLIRLHARQMAGIEDSGPAREAALVAVLEWYFAAADRADLVVTPYRRRLPYTFASQPPALPRLSTRDDALSWLELERVNMVAAGRAALEHGHAELAWHLSDVLWPLLLYRKAYSERMELDRRGVAAARAWANPWAEAVMLKRLGRTMTKAADYPTAERYTRAAISRYRDAGDDAGALDAEEGLAAIHRDAGRLPEAADLLSRILAARRTAGETRSTGLTLINLGTVLPQLGRAAEAVDLLREAERLFRPLAEIDPYNLSRTGTALAGAYLAAGELDLAHRAAADAARQMRNLGSGYEAAEATDLLGRIAERRGDPQAAQRHYGQALEVFVSLGSSRADMVRERLAALTAGGAVPTHQE